MCVNACNYSETVRGNTAETARLLGFEPLHTLEEMIDEAERILGQDCSITSPLMDQSYICNVE